MVLAQSCLINLKCWKFGSLLNPLSSFLPLIFGHSREGFVVQQDSRPVSGNTAFRECSCLEAVYFAWVCFIGQIMPMNARIKGFAAELCTVVRWSILLPSVVRVWNHKCTKKSLILIFLSVSEYLIHGHSSSCRRSRWTLSPLQPPWTTTSCKIKLSQICFIILTACLLMWMWGWPDVCQLN